MGDLFDELEGDLEPPTEYQQVLAFLTDMAVILETHKDIEGATLLRYFTQQRAQNYWEYDG